MYIVYIFQKVAICNLWTVCPCFLLIYTFDQYIMKEKFDFLLNLGVQTLSESDPTKTPGSILFIRVGFFVIKNRAASQ